MLVISNQKVDKSCPGLNVNLLSVTQCLRFPGVTFGGDSDGLGSSFGGKYYKFDKELIHGNGKLYKFSYDF
jgi:hypothetical protein